MLLLVWAGIDFEGRQIKVLNLQLLLVVVVIIGSIGDVYGNVVGTCWTVVVGYVTHDAAGATGIIVSFAYPRWELSSCFFSITCNSMDSTWIASLWKLREFFLKESLRGWKLRLLQLLLLRTLSTKVVLQWLSRWLFWFL